MSYLFTESNSDWLNVTLNTNSTTVTMACWAMVPSTTNVDNVMSLSESADAGRQIALQLFNNSTLRASSRYDSGFVNGQTTDTITADTWHHCAGIWDGTSSRTPYLDGVAGATGTDTVTQPNADMLAVGALGDSTPSVFMSGNVGDAAVWDVALTQGEINSLAAGMSPFLVRPQSLLGYALLINDTIEVISGTSMTINGTPTADVHPPIFYPVGIQYTAEAVSGNTGATTEGLSLAETQSPQVATSAATTEGLSLAETQSPQVATDSAVSEGISLAETSIGAKTLAAAIAEGISLNETSAAAIMVLAGVSEGVSLAETQASDTGAIAAAITEGIALNEAAMATLSAIAAATEGLAFNDSAAFGGTIAAAISEGFSLSETVAAAVAMGAQVTEDITFNDTATASAVFNAAVTETLSFDETGGVQISTGAAVSEGVAFNDTTTPDGDIPTATDRIVVIRAGVRIIQVKLPRRIVLIEG